MKVALLPLLCLFASTAFGTVTMQFSQSSVARATGFANHAGVGTGGMRWGIVIDAGSNALQGGSYDVFDTSVSGFLSVGGVTTDDYYFAGGLTVASVGSTPTIPSGNDPGGTGVISQLTNVAIPYGTGGIGSGDAFSLIWFDGASAANSYYGMLANTGPTAAFTLPNDGDTVSYAAYFAGTTADPIKAANLQFPGAAPVPEPSRMMLLGFGLIGLFFRRRR